MWRNNGENENILELKNVNLLDIYKFLLNVGERISERREEISARACCHHETGGCM